MLKIITVSTLLFVTLSPLQAETFLLDAIEKEPANNSQGLPRPHTGMSMTQVVLKYGPAEREMPAVGKPPITRWRYPDYTVYFENDRVINTVVNH